MATSPHYLWSSSRRSRLFAFLATLGSLHTFAGCGSSGPAHYAEPPVIESFIATRSPVSAGTASALIATYRGVSAVVDQGVGEVASGAQVAVLPRETTRYTLTVIGESGETATAEATIEVLEAPHVPTIEAPQYVTANLSGYVATVESRSGLRYDWTIEGGTIEGASSGASIAFSAGEVGSLRLGCTATDAMEATATSSFTALVVASPASPVLKRPAFVQAGKSYGASVEAPMAGVLYAWSIEGAQSATAQGSSITFTPNGVVGGEVRFRCIGTNQAGTEGPAGLATSAIIEAQQAPALTAPAYVTAGLPAVASVTSPDPSSRYAWSIEGGTLEAVEGSSVTFTPTGAAGSSVTLTCVETNVAGSESLPGTVGSQIVAPPTAPTIQAPLLVTALGAYSASVAAPGAQTTYHWTIEGGQLANDSGTSVTFVPTGAAKSELRLTCVERNRAGHESAAASAVALIVAEPLAPTLALPQLMTEHLDYSAQVVGPNPASTYTWSITGGTLSATSGTSVTFTVGAVAEGEVTLGCVETNEAGSAGSAGVGAGTIVAAPGRPTISLPQHVTAGWGTSASVVTLSGTSTYSWTLSGGSTSNTKGPTISFIPTALPGQTVTLSCVETNLAGTSGEPGTAAAIVVDGSQAPVLQLPQFVTAGTSATATLQNRVHTSTYAWSILNGNIDNESASGVTFTPNGAPGEVVILSCVETNQAGSEGIQATALAAIVAPPLTPIVGAPTFVVPPNAYVASVQNYVGTSTYEWALTGATPTTHTGAQVDFAPTGSGGTSVTISCTEVNQAGERGTPAVLQVPIAGSSAVPIVAVAPYVTAGIASSALVQSPVGSSTYHWGIAGGDLASSTGTSVSFTPAGLPGTKVDLSCVERTVALEESAPGVASTQIVAPPVAPVLHAPEHITTARAFSASVQSPVGTSSYEWTIEGALPAKAWGPSFTFTPTAAAGEQVKLTCVETNRAGTVGPATERVSSVVGAPRQPEVELPLLVTAGLSAEASVREPVDGSRYTWSIRGGTIPSPEGQSVTFTPTGAAGSTVTLTAVEANLANNTGAPGSAVATIVAAPQVPLIGLPNKVTAGKSYTASVQNPVAASTYHWSITGGELASTSGLSVSFTAGAGGTLILTCTERNQALAEGNPGTASAAIVAAPVAPLIVAPSGVLANKSYVANVANWVASSTYRWTLTNALPATALGREISFKGQGAIGQMVTLTCVETNEAGSDGPSASLPIPIVELPPSPAIDAPLYATIGAVVQARVLGPEPTSSYRWTITGGLPNIANGTEVSFQVESPTAVTLTCVEINGMGIEGSPGSASVIAVAPPVIPAITAPAKVTQGRQYTASIAAPVSGSTYGWSIAGGSLVTSAGSSVSFIPASSGTVTLTAVETNRAGTVGAAGSTPPRPILDEPDATIFAPAGVLEGEVSSADVFEQSGMTYQWTVDHGALSGSTSYAVAFTPASANRLTLGCTVTNAAGDSTTGWTEVEIWPRQSTTMLDEQAVQLSVGFSHSCVVSRSGKVRCWGSDDRGQLGNGAPLERSHIPLEASGITGATVVATGDYHTCAILSGAVKCWGANDKGQLGNGLSLDSATPVALPSLSSGVVALALGGEHSCALTSAGGVKCWGRNDHGQVGDGSNVDRSSPVDVFELTSGVKALAAGKQHTCALMQSGQMRCWGAGEGADALTSAAIAGFGAGDEIVGIAAGKFHTCARLRSGELKCWGDNSLGQLGDGTAIRRVTPTSVPTLGSGVTAIALGAGHTCAVTRNNGVKCWGYNSEGQLGAGGSNNSNTPLQVVGLGAEIESLDAGEKHVCALTRAGAVLCWGSNGYLQSGRPEGQLGDTPRHVASQAGGVEQVAVGGNFACALTLAGGVKCWGGNQYGALGLGTLGGQTDGPTGSVIGLESGVASVVAGATHACALMSNGAVKCWGGNTYGAVGDGSTVDRPAPAQVTGLTSGVAAIAAGSGFTCAMTTAGGVKCWGMNSAGQLGVNAWDNKYVPTQVSGLTSGTKSISAGSLHACALATDGKIRCWGFNSSSQLGNGAVASSAVPVVATNFGALIYSAIGAGAAHTCALTSSGEVRCLGDNTDGQLGDGTKIGRSAPVVVSGLSGIAKLSVGGSTSCALSTTGGAKCWGDNSSAQLGDDTVTDRPTPIEMRGLSSGVRFITPGANSSCAVLGSGALQCWGVNGDGQVGNDSGDEAYSPFPVRAAEILSFDLPSSLALGGRVRLISTTALSDNSMPQWESLTPETCRIAMRAMGHLTVYELAAQNTAAPGSLCWVRATASTARAIPKYRLLSIEAQ